MVVLHPQRPAPVDPPDVQFKTLIITDKDGKKVPYNALSRDDTAAFGKWMEEVSAFIKKQNNLLCFYRKELKEDDCKDVKAEGK